MDSVITTCIFICVVEAEVTIQVTNIQENETNAVTFSCQATGEPVPVIIWYFDGVMINISNAKKYSINISSSINGTKTSVTSLLTIMDVQSYDVSKYICIATNIIGSDQSFGILTVNGTYVYVYVNTKSNLTGNILYNVMFTTI